MEWLSSFFYALSEFIPRLLHVTEDMRCIKLARGSHRKLDPGYHVYWPLIHEIRTCYITRQELDLPDQILTTTDDKTIVVSTSVVYRISGVTKALISTQDYESTTIEVAQRAVKQLVSSSSFEDLLAPDHNIEDTLIALMQKDLHNYGLKVDNAFFTSLSKSKSHHITGVYLNNEQPTNKL
jgi:regulator of protease activity HflC (stomatin/prohibitin superfamily)